MAHLQRSQGGRLRLLMSRPPRSHLTLFSNSSLAENAFPKGNSKAQSHQACFEPPKQDFSSPGGRIYFFVENITKAKLAGMPNNPKPKPSCDFKQQGLLQAVQEFHSAAVERYWIIRHRMSGSIAWLGQLQARLSCASERSPHSSNAKSFAHAFAVKRSEWGELWLTSFVAGCLLLSA